MTVPVRREKQQGKPLSEIFNHFTKDSAERFPVLKGNLLIFDNNEKVSYGLIKKAACTPAAMEAFIKERTVPDKVETQADWDWNNVLNVNFILYNEPVPAEEWRDLSEATEKDILYIMDHELAHIVIETPSLAGENKQYKRAIEEAISDAYATIRYYQRYGTQTDYQHKMIDPWARAGALTFNTDTAHFSTFMLDEIVKRKDIIDFASLTPAQTIELARRFAVDYTPPSSVVNRMTKKLKTVREAYKSAPETNGWLKVLAGITLDPKNDHYTFKLCSKILRGYLDGRTDMHDLSAKSTTGTYWDNIRKRLDKADAKFAQEGILFNIPLIKSGKPPRPVANQNKL